jgi:hypothetical protein
VVRGKVEPGCAPVLHVVYFATSKGVNFATSTSTSTASAAARPIPSQPPDHQATDVDRATGCKPELRHRIRSSEKSQYPRSSLTEILSRWSSTTARNRTENIARWNPGSNPFLHHRARHDGEFEAEICSVETGCGWRAE